MHDQLSISTPELVAIEFPLAGIGSRFVALLVDYLIQGVAALVLLLLFIVMFAGGASTRAASNAVGSSGAAEKWAIAMFIAVPFLFQWGYFTLFEAFWHGQTPGKRLMHLRVIQQTGRPAGLFESMGRNFLRIIDMLPAIYVIGVICMFFTRRQQRLGDLLAGTLVVHERSSEMPLESLGSTRTFTAPSYQPNLVAAPRISRLPADAVAQLGLADLHALESYLARRLDVPMNVRVELAAKLSSNVARKMNLSVPEGMSQETFLEEAAFALRGMSHLRS